MAPPKVDHFPSCTPNYPEKPKGEKPQQINPMDIGDGETAWTCVDCGAFVVTDTVFPKVKESPER